MSVMNCIEAEEGVAEYWQDKKTKREEAEEFARTFWKETERIKEEKKKTEERQKEQERLNKACSVIENFVDLYFDDDIDNGNNFIYEVINGKKSLREAIYKYNIKLLFEENLRELENAFYVCQANRYMPYVKSRKDLYRLQINR